MADPNIFSFPEELLRKKKRPDSGFFATDVLPDESLEFSRFDPVVGRRRRTVDDFFSTEIFLDPGEPLEFSRFDYVAKWRGRAMGPDFFCTPWLPPSVVRTSAPYNPPRVPMLRGAGRIPRKFGRVVG